MYDTDQFLKNCSLLTEGRQISKLEEIISGDMFKGIFKKSLPKTAAKYGELNNELLIFKKLNMKAKPNNKLNSYINSQMDSSSKGVIIKSYILKEKSPNAFTIPGVYLGMNTRDMTMSKLIFGSYSAKKFNISGDISGSGKAILNASSKVAPLIVLTSGLNDDKRYTMDEKMAILMHEVGHWSIGALGSQAPASVISIASTINSLILVIGLNVGITYRNILILITLMIMFFFLLGVLSRSAEFAADAFAKKIGKGKELSDALQKMGGDNIVKNKKELDEISGFFDKISPIVDFITGRSHPSTNRRSGRLLENNDILQEGVLTELSDTIFDSIMNPIMAKLDNISTSEFRPMLWAYGSK